MSRSRNALTLRSLGYISMKEMGSAILEVYVGSMAGYLNEISPDPSVHGLKMKCWRKVASTLPD